MVFKLLTTSDLNCKCYVILEKGNKGKCKDKSGGRTELFGCYVGLFQRLSTPTHIKHQVCTHLQTKPNVMLLHKKEMLLTALCDVADAAVYYDGYVYLCKLLLAQSVSSTPCCRLDCCTPASKIQFPFSLYVQSST